MAATISDGLVKLLQPAPFTGKSAVEGLAFLAKAKRFFDALPTSLTAPLKFTMILGLLTEDAANWAMPFFAQLDASPPCWSTFDEFEKAFKAHFCAIDDQEAAYQELCQLGRRSERPRLDQVKDWTAKFNATAAHTKLGDEDRRQRYFEGLPAELQKALAVGGRDISSLALLQAAALTVSQTLATVAANQFQPFKGKGKNRQQVNAAGTGRAKETRTCFVCGKPGHLAQNCSFRKVAATSETDALKAQIDELTKQLAALKGVEKEEGF